MPLRKILRPTMAFGQKMLLASAKHLRTPIRAGIGSERAIRGLGVTRGINQTSEMKEHTEDGGMETSLNGRDLG